MIGLVTVPGGGCAEKCTEPKEAGKCSAKLARWAFSKGDNKCVPFYYSGCEGNSNNYRTEDECEASCPAEKGVLSVQYSQYFCPLVLPLTPCPYLVSP